MRFIPGRFYVALYLILFGLCGGCGSGDKHDNPSPSPSSSPGSNTPGSVLLSIEWPSRGVSRSAPLASESMVVVFQDAARHELGRAKAVRSEGDAGSTSEVRFNNVPVGNYLVSASAFPQADGSGVAQARAEFPLTVASGKETAQDLSPASTITGFVIEPFVPAPLLPEQSLALQAVARDASGAIVLTRSVQFTWQSSDAGVATVGAGSGVVVGVSAGQVVVTVRDTESGVSAQIALTVAAGERE